jgi:hypothetical protein
MGFTERTLENTRRELIKNALKRKIKIALKPNWFTQIIYVKWYWETVG